MRVRAAGPQRRRHAPARGPLPGAARLAAGHPRARAGRRGGRARPGRDALRRGRSRDGDRRRRRPGGAVPRARAPADAGARRLDWPAAGGVRRSSRPPTTRSSRRPGLRPASACSCTARPAASAPRRSSSARAAGAHVTATVRNEELRDGVAELGAHAVLDPEGFAEHGPFDVVLELVGAPEHRRRIDALATGGRIVGDRRRRRASRPS